MESCLLPWRDTRGARAMPGARAAAGRIASAWGSGVGERREAGGGGEGAEGGGRKRPRGLADDETIL